MTYFSCSETAPPGDTTSSRDPISRTAITITPAYSAATSPASPSRRATYRLTCTLASPGPTNATPTNGTGTHNANVTANAPHGTGRPNDTDANTVNAETTDHARAPATSTVTNASRRRSRPHRRRTNDAAIHPAITSRPTCTATTTTVTTPSSATASTSAAGRRIPNPSR